MLPERDNAVTALRMTSADLELLPDPGDGRRYEIIDGVLYVSKQPRFDHQYAADGLTAALRTWSAQSKRGVAVTAPGIIFENDDNVAPDLIWISNERLRTALWDDGHFHEAPELVVEVLSPGEKNAGRDRELKPKVYARQGVAEYWIVDTVARCVDVFRHDGEALRQVAVVSEDEDLESPLLPGFRLPVGQVFFPGPPREEPSRGGRPTCRPAAG
jgi:Uma2 family endonuclease